MLLDNKTNYPNVSRTISGIGNIVFDTDVVLLCDTSLGIVELTLLEIPLNHFSTQYKLYVVDNSNNASINPIKIIAPSGFLIDEQPYIFNSINNSSIIVRISSNFDYNSSNYGTLAVEDEGILIASDVRLIDFTGTGVTATAIGTSVTVAVSGGAIAVSDESILLTPSVSSFNFLGTGITATNVGTAVTVTVPQNLIETLDEGISLTTNTQSLNFTGTGVTATAIGNAVTVNVLAVPITTFDEGILKTATTQSFNFVGGGITATNVGNAVTVTVPTASVPIETYDEGILKTATTQSFNFVGGGITATNVGNAVTVTVPTASVPIETYDEGILKTATTQSFNFVGAGITATNVGNAVTVTVPQNLLETLDEGVSLTLTTASYNIVGDNIKATNVVNAVTITADPFIVSHTYATLLTAISTNSLIAGQTVFITDAIYTTFFNNILIEVSLEALSTNTISLKGSGTFFNADYQTVGDYSGVAGYTGQTGVYNASTSYTIGKVCIYNNLHYKAIAVSLNNLPTNPAFWVLLAFTGAPALTNGYIREIDIINYDIQSNNIIYREDIRKNRVYQDKVGSVNKVFALFQFGKNSVNNNNLVNSSYADIVNSTGGFFFNDLDSSGLTGTVVNSNENSGNISGNNFKNTTISFRNVGGASIINYNNFFQNSNLTINNTASGTIMNNDFGFNGALLLQNTGKFNSNKVYRSIGSNFINVNPTYNCELNLFDGCNITYLDTNNLVSNIFINSTFNITNNGLVAPELFTNNQIINCQIFDLVNSGNFNNNIIDNTSVNLTVVTGCSFNGNQFKDSNLNLSYAFSGTYDFLENIITNNTQIIFYQDFVGIFSGNNFNESTIEYQVDYNGNFTNNVISFCTIIYYDFSSQFVTNNIFTKSTIFFFKVQIDLLFANDLIDCAITIQNNSLKMLNNNWNDVQFNPYSNAPIIVQTTIINSGQYFYDVNFIFIDTIGGICADGINTITRELDFSDPNIKVAGDLTIPACFVGFYGIFLIKKGTATVDRIFNLSLRYNTTFKFSNLGSTLQDFQSLALPSIINGIVSALGTFTYKLKNQAGVYTDEITFSKHAPKMNKVVSYVAVI
jgi:hypothetical protein